MTVSCWKDRIKCQTISFLLSPTSCHSTSLFLRSLFSRTVYALVRAFSSPCIHLSDSNRETTVSGTVLDTRGVFYKINNRVSLTSSSFHLIEKICILCFIGTQPRGTWWNEPSARRQRTELGHTECTVRPWATRVTYVLLHWKSSGADTVCLAGLR